MKFVHPTAEIHPSASLDEETKIWNWAQVREGARIGKHCVISKSVYVDAGVEIGDYCKLQNNVSIYNGVTLERGVFCGPHVCFTNDRHPRAITPDGHPRTPRPERWKKTLVREGATIGANATIIAGVKIGRFALVGAGSVVAKDVPDYALAVGNPARVIGEVCACGTRIRAGETCPECKHRATF